MKAFFSILVVIILLGLLAGVARGIKTPVPRTSGVTPSGGLSTRLQVCPDGMIVNKMPGPGGSKPSYYILKGERREVSEFDDAWVAQNCNVVTETVY